MLQYLRLPLFGSRHYSLIGDFKKVELSDHCAVQSLHYLSAGLRTSKQLPGLFGLRSFGAVAKEHGLLAKLQPSQIPQNIIKQHLISPPISPLSLSLSHPFAFWSPSQPSYTGQAAAILDQSLLAQSAVQMAFTKHRVPNPVLRQGLQLRAHLSQVISTPQPLAFWAHNERLGFWASGGQSLKGGILV